MPGPRKVEPTRPDVREFRSGHRVGEAEVEKEALLASLPARAQQPCASLSHSISEHTISTFSKMSADFDSAGCKLLAITKASVFTVQMWLKTMSGAGSIIPIIADQKEEFIR